MNLAQVIDALGGLFSGFLLVHFRRVLDAVTNDARANIRRWSANVALLTRFNLGAALKPTLVAFLLVFLTFAILGVLSTLVAGVEIPDGWIAIYLMTVLGTVTTTFVLLAYVWGNHMLPASEIERMERQLRHATALTPHRALAALETQIADRLERRYGGRAPIVASLILMGASLLALGIELVYLSTVIYRWENDLNWWLSIWTAFVGCLALYSGASCLRAPFQIAGAIANVADAPMDWGINFLLQSGLILFPGYTAENVRDRIKVNIPAEKVGAFFERLGSGVMSSIRFFVGVTMVMNSLPWTAGATLIGFMAGLAIKEQEEIGRISTQPQITEATKFFWGPRGIFVLGMIGRVGWSILSTPAHAATAPSGPDVPPVERVTGVVESLPAQDGWFMSLFHHFLALPFWNGVGGMALTLVAAWIAYLGFFSGTEAFDGKLKGLTRASWVVIGAFCLLVLIPAAFTILSIFAGWIGVVLHLLPPSP